WKLVSSIFTLSLSFNDANDILHCLFLGYIIIKLAKKVNSENVSESNNNDDDIRTYVAAEIVTNDKEKTDVIESYIAADMVTNDIEEDDDIEAYLAADIMNHNDVNDD